MDLHRSPSRSALDAVVEFARRRAPSLSGIGLALGTLFFAAALTPTLIPRTYVTQGVLAGACAAAGYGLGVFWRWLWIYLELPGPSERTRRITNSIVAIFCLTVVVVFLWRTAEWQNSIRRVMEMEPLESAHPLKLCVTAIVTFIVILLLARLFALVVNRLSGWMHRYVPRRIANVIGVAIAALLFWSLASDVLFRAAFNVADSSFREFDALIEPERPQPADPLKTGSASSLIAWNELGRAGREFVASAPSKDELAAYGGTDALEPVRVYVGLRAAEKMEERARLALEELKRVDAFSRSALVVITPTGTGWIDPAAIDAVEYLHNGDIASVALQYSYLNSPLALLVQPEYGRDAARALFTLIYDYWTALPEATRPKLYLHGLSLGAMHSQSSVELFEIIGDPFHGALWSGPPFESRMWRSFTEGRNEGSPAWLPEFRDGQFVRFMNQNGSTVPADTPWGPLRIVYLQYASDAVTFFDYRDLYRQPAWMSGQTGSDVSPELRWYPIVTMLQLAVDMAVATTPPVGYGHVYAPEHYVDAWMEVTGLDNWDPARLDGLKQHLGAIARQASGKSDTNEDAYDNRGG